MRPMRGQARLRRQIYSVLTWRVSPSSRDLDEIVKKKGMRIDKLRVRPQRACPSASKNFGKAALSDPNKFGVLTYSATADLVARSLPLPVCVTCSSCREQLRYRKTRGLNRGADRHQVVYRPGPASSAAGIQWQTKHLLAK